MFDPAEAMIGQVVKAVTQGEDEIRLEMQSGRQWAFNHVQECCESVVIHSMN